MAAERVDDALPSVAWELPVSRVSPRFFLPRHIPSILLWCAIALVATGSPLARAADTGQPTGTVTVAEAGTRYGQALAAERFCPGGRLTASARALHDAEPDRATFDREAEKIVESWTAALSCLEADPATGRPIASCRRIKMLSCRQAWLEIGPEGTMMPGLLEQSLDGVGPDGITRQK